MRLLLFVVGAILCISGPVSAQDNTQSGEIGLELNRANESPDGGCQVVFFASNGLDSDLQDVTWLLAVFDDAGVFDRMLSLPLGRLNAGKRRVVQYNLPTACAQMSEIIVNDIAACQAGNTSTNDDVSDICLTNLSVSSRTEIAFGL